MWTYQKEKRKNGIPCFWEIGWQQVCICKILTLMDSHTLDHVVILVYQRFAFRSYIYFVVFSNYRVRFVPTLNSMVSVSYYKRNTARTTNYNCFDLRITLVLFFTESILLQFNRKKSWWSWVARGYSFDYYQQYARVSSGIFQSSSWIFGTINYCTSRKCISSSDFWKVLGTFRNQVDS